MRNKELKEFTDLNDLIVVKRSGQRVAFNASKIAIAIKKAFDSVYKELDEKEIYKVFEKTLKYINDVYKERKTINVEDIQDIIENILKNTNYNLVYESFIRYRQKRAASRKVFSEKEQHKFVKVIEKLEDESNNLNNAITPKEAMKKFGKIIATEYAKSYVLDAKYIRSLEEGSIYIHNLDYFSLGFIPRISLKLNVSLNDDNLDKLLMNIINPANEISKEINISNFDNLVYDYLINRFKKKLEEKIKEYLQLFGFTNLINFKKIEDLICKINSLDINTYNFEICNNNEVLTNIFNKAINNAKEIINKSIDYAFTKLLKGIENTNKKYIISISINKDTYKVRNSLINYIYNNNLNDNISFIFKIDKYCNEEYLNKIALLIKTNKNIYINTNSNYEYFTDGEKILNDNAGKMISASTSINMARLSLKYYNKDKELFYKELDSTMEFVKNELLLMFETLGNKNKENYEYLFNGNVYGDERLESNQKIRKIIKSGYINIGIVGICECVSALQIDSTKRYKIVEEILKYMQKVIARFNEETKLNFTLFESCDEEVRKSLIAIDKSIYGKIKELTNKSTYDLLSNAAFINDNNELSNITKLLNGGNMYIIKINSKTDILKILNDLVNWDIPLVRFLL